MIDALLLALADPAPQITSPSPAASLVPVIPGVNAPAPPGVPPWLVVTGYVLALLGTVGIGGVLVRLVDGAFGRRKNRAESGRTEVEAGEILTRVSVTMVEPLRDRLDEAERRIREQEKRHAEDRAAFEKEVSDLRLKVRSAMEETDAATNEAFRLRLLVQKWHRSIMDPTATLEWLRQLVGPDEPAI